MEIVRISNTQVKFILTKTDLVEHNVKIAELAYGSQKAQELFRHMMAQALAECSFETENSPLMIEAIPTTIDSITVIVTKVTNPEQIEERFNMIPRVSDLSKMKFKSRKPVIPGRAPQISDIMIYSFDVLDRAIDAAARINGIFSGDSVLFKFEGSYFIYANNDFESENRTKLEAIETIIGEYGQKHASTTISKAYLEEHGEIIVANDAIKKLALTK